MAQQQNTSGSGERRAASHLGEVTIELLPSEERSIGSVELASRWRELTGPIPGAVELLFSSDVMSAGDAINVQFAGPGVESLRRAADELKERLAEFPGTFAITDSFRGGKQELRLDILPAAQALEDAHNDYLVAVTRALLDLAVEQGSIDSVDTAAVARTMAGLGRDLSRPEVMATLGSSPKDAADGIVDVVLRGLRSDGQGNR